MSLEPVRFSKDTFSYQASIANNSSNSRNQQEDDDEDGTREYYHSRWWLISINSHTISDDIIHLTTIAIRVVVDYVSFHTVLIYSFHHYCSPIWLMHVIIHQSLPFIFDLLLCVIAILDTIYIYLNIYD
jgi:hypothetical protein